KASNKELASFFRKRPDIAVQKAENVSVARALEIRGHHKNLVRCLKLAQEIAGVLSTDECITKQPKTKRQNNKRRQPFKKQKKASSSSESEEVVLGNSEEEEERLSNYENESVGCDEDFQNTKKKDDWFQYTVLLEVKVKCLAVISLPEITPNRWKNVAQVYI
ncbi:hypothetical protein ILUMI_16226, partial [Ignelater luminosus]